MKTYTVNEIEVAHNELIISDHDELQEFLLNELGSSNEFDEEIKNFMFIHMSGTDRTFELTGGATDDKVIIIIYEGDKVFEIKSFYLNETCHISGKPVVFEGKGDGIREYDVCCECDEKTHPDEMVTLPEEDDRMEICSKCHEEELERAVKEELICSVIDQVAFDMQQGDTTVLAEILETKDTNYLKGCLPEEGF